MLSIWLSMPKIANATKTLLEHTLHAIWLVIFGTSLDFFSLYVVLYSFDVFYLLLKKIFDRMTA